MTLGAVPFDSSIEPISADWKLFCEADVAKPPNPVVVYCIYCKAAGHQNTPSVPCPLLAERDNKSTCGNCKQKGHISRYCPKPKACTFCGSNKLLSEDLKNCPAQYFPRKSAKYGVNIHFDNHPLVIKYETWAAKQNLSKSKLALSAKNFAPLPNTSNSPAQPNQKLSSDTPRVDNSDQIRGTDNIFLEKSTPPDSSSIVIPSSSSDDEKNDHIWDTCDEDRLVREKMQAATNKSKKTVARKPIDDSWSEDDYVPVSKNSKKSRKSVAVTSNQQRPAPQQGLSLANKFSLFNEQGHEAKEAQDLVDQVHDFVEETASGSNKVQNPIDSKIDNIPSGIIDLSLKPVSDCNNSVIEVAEKSSVSNPSVANESNQVEKFSAATTSSKSNSVSKKDMKSKSANKKNTKPKSVSKKYTKPNQPSKLLNDSTNQLLKVKDWAYAQEQSSFAKRNGLTVTLADLNPPSVSELPPETESDSAESNSSTTTASNNNKSYKSKSKNSRSACGLMDRSKIEKNAAKAVFDDVFGERRSFSQFVALMDKHNFSYFISEQNITRIIHKCNELGIRASYRETVRDKLIMHIDTVRKLAAAQKDGLRIDLSKLPPCRITKTKKTTTTSRHSMPTSPSFDVVDKARTRSMSRSCDYVPFANQNIDYNFSANDKLKFGGGLV